MMGFRDSQKTPGYIVGTREGNKDMLKIYAGKVSAKFEVRIKGGVTMI